MTAFSSTEQSWQAIAAEAQRHRDATIKDPLIQPPIPQVSGTNLPLDVTSIPTQYLTFLEVKITESSPEQLLSQLAARTLTATAVTQAFLRRAGIAQQLTNCLTELLPSRALARAAELDDYFQRHGKLIGTLHGLPISIKEHCSFASLSLSYGFVGRYHDRGAADAQPLRILHDAGAVFYARTTEPQTVMHLECSSNLYGVTVNPFNTRLSSGGSSGGEGALIGLRGSCLGLGTDIGGSIRSPAGNCGLFGLRPTTKRLPYKGVEQTVVGTGGVLPVQGPLSTSIEGIKLYTKCLLDASPWIEDDSVVPLPWKDVSVKKSDRLRVGVMWDDGIVKPHPPVRRALKQVVDRLLLSEGVEIVEFQGYKHDIGWEIISSLYFADGGQRTEEEMDRSGEPMRPLTKWLLKDEGHVKRLTVESQWSWERKREEFQTEYNKRWLRTAGGRDGKIMDVLLCPYFPSASSRLDTAKYWAYTSTWNLLDYPAITFPVSRVDPAVDKVDEHFESFGEQDTRNHKLYDPEIFQGAPISLQLIGRRFEEEKLIAATEYIVGQLQLPWAKFT